MSTVACSMEWDGEGIVIRTLRRCGMSSSGGASEASSRWSLVLVRSGAHRRRLGGVDHLVDANCALLERPVCRSSVTGSTTASEVLTVVEFDPAAVSEVPGVALVTGLFSVDPGLALAHRLLLGAVRSDRSSVDVGANVGELLGRCLRQPRPRQPIGRRSSTASTRRRLVNDALEALHLSMDHTLGLVELARRVGASHCHLSRVFREVTGVTMSEYRTRLRLHGVLDHLLDGDDDLATIAAATGFADHGHMTRVVTRFMGATPSELRARLRSWSECSNGDQADSIG